jgi:hypothetical protein
MMRNVRGFISKVLGLVALSSAFAALSGSLVPASAEVLANAPEDQSKKAAVEVTEGNDKRMQTLNEVVAPSYQKISPESAKVKEEIMDDLEHNSEPEPFCYYPI